MKMKTTIRSRGPKGQFIKRPSHRKNLQTGKGVFVLRLVIAGSLAVIMALMLARCHIVWSGGHIIAPIELPRDLLTPLE